MSIVGLVPPGPPVLAGALLTPQEVGRQLAVSRSMVYQLIRRGELHALYVGRCPRVRPEDLATFLSRAADRRRP